jgi:hypothetical protein
MKKLLYIFYFTGIFMNSIFVSAQQITAELNRQMELIQNASNVEKLYSVRANLGKYASREDISIADQKLLGQALRSLAQGFKSGNHFRNAADVYKTYLAVNEKYLRNYHAFLIDSLKKANDRLAIEESAKIDALDASIKELNQTKEAVGGLKQKYYSIGGFAALAIVLVFAIIFLSRNRAISKTQSDLKANQLRLTSLHKELIDARMKTGAIRFSEDFAGQLQETSSKLIAALEQDADKKLFVKDLEALRNIQKLAQR